MRLLDNYSLLHFAVGVLAYFWGIGFWTWNFLHTLFELLENTRTGMHIINTYITAWPGGKSNPDPVINSVGDVLSGSVGWLAAALLSKWVGSNPRAP